METRTYTESLVIEHCCNCGIAFAVTRDFHRKCTEDSGFWFHCPAGHRQHYSKGEVQRLRQEVAQLTETKDGLSNLNTRLQEKLLRKEYSIRALKAAKTKIINRVKNGVCPCCNRSFTDLQRHFKTKHPEVFDKK